MQQPPNDQPNWQQPQYEGQPPQYQPSYPQQPSQPNWPPQQSGQLPPQYPQQGYPQYTQYPQQPPTGPGTPPPQWQQPYPYQQPGMPPQYPMPPQQPSRQPNFFRRKAGCLPMWAILLIIAIFACVGASAIANSGNTTTTNTSDNGAQVAATNSAQLAATNSAQGTTDTPVPTATLDTSIPTSTPAPTSGQTESAYKKSTTSTTVDNLDKNGNADKGKDVHFTCKILKFVKDDNGNTAGANVESPDTYSSSILQIVFPSGTDITRLNEGDTVEVWGTDAGVFSGQNAFGGTVQEVGIAALYLTDKTTNYQTH